MAIMSAYSGPKGLNRIAQGNALGKGPAPPRFALKGQDKAI
jgi:hypothetical protein